MAGLAMWPAQAFAQIVPTDPCTNPFVTDKPITCGAKPGTVPVPVAQAANNALPGATANNGGGSGPCGSKPGATQAPQATGTVQYCTPFNESQSPTPVSSEEGNAFIRKYISPTIKAMSALVGIFVAGSLIFAGIQYSTAGGDSGKVSAAKQRILKAIVTLAAYVFFYAFMRWILPSANL